MNRPSIVCVTLLVAGSMSAARADVEFSVPDKKAPAAHPAPAPAPAAAPAPIIADKPGMPPPVVPGKQPAAPAAAPTRHHRDLVGTRRVGDHDARRRDHRHRSLAGQSDTRRRSINRRRSTRSW